LDKAPPIRADIRALCMYSDAYLKASLGDRVGAIEIDRHALALLKTAGETRSTSYNYVLAGLGVALLNEGHVGEALAIYRESVDAYVRNGRGGTRMALLAEQDVSSTLYRIGEVRESYAIARRLYDKFAKLNSEADTSAAFTVNIAGIANRLALSDPTQNLLPAEIARAEKEGDLQFFRLGSVELARLRLWHGAPREQIDAPLTHIESFHLAQKKELTPATRVLIETVRTELDLRDGQARSASDRTKRLLRYLADKDFHAPRPNFLAHCSASKAALAMGDIAGAIDEARIALKLAEPMARGPDTSADVGEALLQLGRALQAQGRQAEALPLLQRALRCLRNGYGPDHPSTREAERLNAAAPAMMH
jgi:tetratricopeptide (TPR) repeat protein